MATSGCGLQDLTQPSDCRISATRCLDAAAALTVIRDSVAHSLSDESHIIENFLNLNAGSDQEVLTKLFDQLQAVTKLFVDQNVKENFSLHKMDYDVHTYVNGLNVSI